LVGAKSGFLIAQLIAPWATVPDQTGWRTVSTYFQPTESLLPFG
jgi:hypothetical protein